MGLRVVVFTKASERTGQAQQIPAQARDAIRKSVKSAKLDVYSSKADGTLRRVVATATFEAPGPGGKNVAGDVRFDLQVTQVDKPQKVVAPRHAAPFSSLDQSSLGFGSLGTLGSGSAGTQSQGPQRSRPSRSEKPARHAEQSTQASSQAYVACVQKAPDVPALTKCQPLLP